jgi:signal peptidase I
MTIERVKKYLHGLWREWRIPIFVIVFIVIPVKSSLADWNWVPTGSMNPTILEGDLIFVDKVAYDLRIPLTLYRLAKWSDPRRGDIVICFSPEDGIRLVKRVIGLPGDTIEMKNNTLFLNGDPVAYTRIGFKYKELPSSNRAVVRQAHHPEHSRRVRCVLATEDLDGVIHAVMSIPSIAAMRSFGPVKVPQGSYFVMGDNRDSSRDSRYFGFVERESIVGKAMGVIGSFDITDKYQPRFGRFFESLK